MLGCLALLPEKSNRVRLSQSGFHGYERGYEYPAPLQVVVSRPRVR